MPFSITLEGQHCAGPHSVVLPVPDSGEGRSTELVSSSLPAVPTLTLPTDGTIGCCSSEHLRIYRKPSSQLTAMSKLDSDRSPMVLLEEHKPWGLWVLGTSERNLQAHMTVKMSEQQSNHFKFMI